MPHKQREEREPVACLVGLVSKGSKQQLEGGPKQDAVLEEAQYCHEVGIEPLTEVCK
jgi:hypothetical protein